MDVKKAVKKVVALGVGVSMLGATLLGATASPYDLSEYPMPFVKDGMFNGLMVVGDDAAPADIIGVTDIAMSLQFSSTVKETVSVSGEAGVELSGDSVKIRRAGDVLELREWLGGVTETLDAADAEALKTFTKATLHGAQIIDHWMDPSDGSYFSLCELDLVTFADALEKHKELDAKVRDYVRRNAEKMHEQLEKEEMK